MMCFQTDWLLCHLCGKRQKYCFWCLQLFIIGPDSKFVKKNLGPPPTHTQEVQTSYLDVGRMGQSHLLNQNLGPFANLKTPILVILPFMLFDIFFNFQPQALEKMGDKTSIKDVFIQSQTGLQGHGKLMKTLHKIYDKVFTTLNFKTLTL